MIDTKFCLFAWLAMGPLAMMLIVLGSPTQEQEKRGQESTERAYLLWHDSLGDTRATLEKR